MRCRRGSSRNPDARVAATLVLQGGRPKSVASQAPELRECEISITPFGCPVNITARTAAHGPRIHEWARGAKPALPRRVAGYWVLARRSASDGETADFVCSGPARTTLVEMIAVAGSRLGRSKDGFQAAESEAGLDHYKAP